LNGIRVARNASVIEPIRQTTVSQDGVEYEISVYHAGLGRFTAAWRCKVCDRKGSALSADNSVAAAIGRAKGNLFQHHAATHSPK
jgi:hypothetical protein